MKKSELIKIIIAFVLGGLITYICVAFTTYKVRCPKDTKTIVIDVENQKPGHYTCSKETPVGRLRDKKR